MKKTLLSLVAWIACSSAMASATVSTLSDTGNGYAYFAVGSKIYSADYTNNNVQLVGTASGPVENLSATGNGYAYFSVGTEIYSANYTDDVIQLVGSAPSN
jgi:hypothetical protein